MDIMRLMTNTLPCEIQQDILKYYAQKYIFTELLNSPKSRHQKKIIVLYENIHQAIAMYVDKVHTLHHTNAVAFNVCIDVLEERLYEDEWYVWDDTQQTIRILDLTRRFVVAPNLLKTEIEELRRSLSKHNKVYGMNSFLKNIIMMTRML